MTRIDRREFSSSLAQAGGTLSVDNLPRPLLGELAGLGVDRAALDRIAGDDRVITGAEFNALYEALAVRNDAQGRRVDARVSEELFQALAARVEHPGSSASELSGGSSRPRTVGIAGAQIDAAADLRGRTDGQRPNWFVRALESIAEFFVELFTSRDYITSGERDRDVGRQLAMEHPETLRAILAVPGGEQLLRERLLAQRPSGTSTADWNHTIDDVLLGMNRALDRGAPDLPDDVGRDARLAVRDRAAAIFAHHASGPARRELAATLDLLAHSGLSEQAQLRALSSWDSGGRAASATGAQDLARLLASEQGRTVSPSARDAIISGYLSHPEPAQALRSLEGLLANPGFSRVSAEVQTEYVRAVLDPHATAASTAPALARLASAYSGRLAPLNEVKFGDRTLAAGNEGPEVRAVQRYLRALGFNGTITTESDRFDASTTAAVTDFQRRSGLLDGHPPAAAAGVVNRATLNAMLAEVQRRGIDPLDVRFTTELSLNRPTRATDGPWRATQRWTPALQQEFAAFAESYARARIPANPDGTSRRPEWGERVDCADLSYEALIQFARQRGLPVHLDAGSQTFSHRSSGPIVRRVQASLGAAHLQQFTVPLARGESPRTGDLGNMRWNQSANGHDSRYWHAHNIVGFDPLYREATVIFGSLDDLVRQPALDAFNARGYQLTLHDVPEVEIIDAINDDSGQGRQVGRPEQERRVRALLERFTTGGHRVSDGDVSAFIAMVGDGRNIHRDAPTAVSERRSAFHDLVDGDPWADPTARAAAVTDLNRRFGASFTEADIDGLVRAGNRAAVDREAARLVALRVPAAGRAEAAPALITSARGTVRFNADRDALSDSGLRSLAVRDFNRTFGARVRDSDLQQILRAGNPTAALAEATRIVERRGVPLDQRPAAAAALVQATDDTRRFRRWDFDMFNRHM